MKTIRFHDNKNIISQKVRKEREQLGLSQEGLAKKLQVMGISIDQQAISKLERNARIVTDYEILCLAEIFEMTTDELLKSND